MGNQAAAGRKAWVVATIGDRYASVSSPELLLSAGESYLAIADGEMPVGPSGGREAFSLGNLKGAGLQGQRVERDKVADSARKDAKLYLEHET